MQVPLVKLDDAHYKLVDKMERLTPRPPSLKGATSLTVKGPVRFGNAIVIKGDVTLECTEAQPVTIQNHTYDSGTYKISKAAEEAVAGELQPATA